MPRQLLAVLVFAIAFGFVEAAVVVYLRHLLGAAPPNVPTGDILLLLPGIAFLEPESAVEIISNTVLLNVERIREVTTLMMLGTVAALPAKSLKDWFAYFFLVFGIWDIFYYVFLRLMIGWPTTISDPDILFLLPVPWVGPVFVPVLISSAFVLVSLLYLKRSK